MARALRKGLFLIAVGSVAALSSAASCGGGGSNNTSTGGSSGSGAAPSTSGSGGTTASGTGGSLFAGSGGSMNGPYTDFPKDPIVDASTPPDAPALFGSAGAGQPSGGPCLFEPEPGALFPSNWLRPRFRFAPGADQNLFEIRLHADNEVNDLVVYTANTSWTMPKDMWTLLASHIVDAPITMTVRGAHYDGTQLTGVSVGTSGPITIAPADASGAIVYWTTSSGSALKGFQVGDEAVATALEPPQVKMKTAGDAAVTCVGCHTSTPDGKFASFTAQGPWGNALASIEKMSVGDQPSFMGAGALMALAQKAPLGIHSYSKGHWKTGDHVMVTPVGDSAAFGGSGSTLQWFDLEAPDVASASGVIARNGDSRDVGAPTWSHDGNTIVYVSTDVQFTGRLDNGFADLYTVPYNNRQGGDAKPLPGASDPGLAEYYPAFSPDDQWIAFNRIANGNTMYDSALAEVFVIPAAGGTPTRLAANDPVACLGKLSPGVTNSWPKWAPEAVTVKGKTYYWLIFSSKREQSGKPQLYVTGLVVENGQPKSYSSIYLWNQPGDENNHTPAWDVFKIPPTPPPQ